MHQTIRSRILAAAGRTLSALVTVLTLAGFAGAAHATDTTAPTSVLSNPSLNDHLGTLAINGTASDSESGVSSVTVRLYRSWGWNTEYWTGSTWSSAATNLTVSLGTADASGTRTWNVTSTLPSAANFVIGQYTVWRQVKDVANNSSTAQSVNFYSGTDAAVPSVTLEPQDNQTFPSFTDTNGSIIRGEAWDTGGGAGAGETSLGRVQVRLYKNSSSVNYYWTGSAWSTNVSNLQTTWGTPDANGHVSWHCTAAMPVENNLAPVYYVIRVDAFDRSGNSVNISSSIGILPEDHTQPLVSVTSPSEGAYLASLSQITGTASDPAALDGTPASGLARVDVRLRRVVNGTTQYWNGSTWTTTTSYLASRTELSWIRNTSLPSGANLPSGAYSLLVTAYDNYNNASSNVTRNFSINQRPVAQAQSVTATGRLYSDGDPASITLGATDPDGDAIQSWHIATQPQHGTLTGTGPNLTYIADQGYFGADSFTFTANDGKQDSDPATVSINVTAPPPVDALVKNSGDLDYIGDNITSSDGTNQTVSQTVFAGETATYHVKVEKEVATSSIVLKITGTAESAGWTVRYYGALTNGLDITSQATSANGWRPGLNTASKEFRVDVTPPANLTADSNLTLLVSVGQDNSSAPYDVVKAVTAGKPAVQPDLEIKLAEETAYIGGGTVNADGTNQYKSVQLPVETTQTFHLKVKNTSGYASDIVIQSEAIPTGWTVKYFDALTGGNEVTASVVAGGWRLTNMAANETREFRVEIKAAYPAPDDHPFLITAWSGPTAQDAAKAEVLAQFIQKLQYSLSDGGTFTDVPGNGVIQVQGGAPVWLLAVPGRTRGGDFGGWPVTDLKLKPTWTNLGENGRKNYGGQIIVVPAEAATTQNVVVQAECGNTLSVTLQVAPSDATPVLNVNIWSDSELESVTTGTKRRMIGALVTDWKGNPVAGAHVKFSGANVTINGAGTTDDEVVTDYGGYATVVIEGTSGTGTTMTATVVGVTDGPSVDCNAQL